MSDRDIQRLLAGEERESMAQRLRARFGVADGQRNQVLEWLDERGGVPMAIGAAVLGVFLLVKVISGLVGGS